MNDPALLELFRSELETHLATLNEGLLELEKSPGESGRLEALMRAAHSIKGAARIVGVEAAVRVSHALEDCFVAAGNGKLALGSEAVDALLRGTDCLARLGARAVEASPEEALPQGDLEALLSDIARIRSGGKGSRARTGGESQASPASPQPPPGGPPPAIRPAGNLAGPEVESLRDEVLRLLERGDRLVRLDLSSVQEVDPSGLALLVLAAREAARRNPPARLELAGAAERVTLLLRLARLEEELAGPGRER